MIGKTAKMGLSDTFVFTWYACIFVHLITNPRCNFDGEIAVNCRLSKGLYINNYIISFRVDVISYLCPTLGTYLANIS